MFSLGFVAARLGQGVVCAAIAGCLLGCAGQSGLSKPTSSSVRTSLPSIRFVYAKVTTPDDPDVVGSLRMGLFLHDSPGGADRPLLRSEDKSRPYGPVIAGPIALSPDGRKVAFVANVPGEVAGLDEVISGRVLGTQVWVQDIADGRIQRLSHDFSSLPKPIIAGNIVTQAIAYRDLAWSPDGRFLAAYQQYGAAIPGGAQTDYKWVCWDVTTGKEAAKKPSEIGTWRGIRVISPDRKSIALLPDDIYDTVHDSLTVRIVDTRTKREVSHTVIPRQSVDASLLWMPDGKTLAVTVSFGMGKDAGLYLVSVSDGSITRQNNLGDASMHVALSRDGKGIIALDGTDAKLWDPATGASRTIIGPAGEGIFAVDWVELPAARGSG